MYFTSCQKKAGAFGWEHLECLEVSKTCDAAQIFGVSLVKSYVLTISTEIDMHNEEKVHSHVKQLTPH